MKLRMRHAKTGFCFAGASEWVTEPVLAFDFQAVNSAVDFVIRDNPSAEVQAVAGDLVSTALSLSEPVREI